MFVIALLFSVGVMAELKGGTTNFTDERALRGIEKSP